MKRIILLPSVLVLCAAASHAQTHTPVMRKPVAHAAQAPVKLLTYDDTVSYALGLSIGKFYQQQGIKNLNTSLLARAVKTAMDKDSALFSDEQIGDILMEASNRHEKEERERATLAAAKAKQEGEAFMAKNKTNPDVMTLPDGIQFKILQKGTGAVPADTNNVKVNYIGTLLNGTEFDNSYKRGQALDIDVSGVIKGWTEVLKMMPVGSKWRVWIPSGLAYGDRGAGGAIPPGATLQFDIELLGINK